MLFDFPKKVLTYLSGVLIIRGEYKTGGIKDQLPLVRWRNQSNIRRLPPKPRLKVSPVFNEISKCPWQSISPVRKNQKSLAT